MNPNLRLHYELIPPRCAFSIVVIDGSPCTTSSIDPPVHSCIYTSHMRAELRGSASAVAGSRCTIQRCRAADAAGIVLTLPLLERNRGSRSIEMMQSGNSTTVDHAWA